MKDFLTTTQSAPPAISLGWFLVIVGLLVALGWTSLRKYRDPAYVKTFRIIQIIQLTVLYTWYVVYSLPISNSLPLYHCRLAMFALVLWPGKSRFKQYFALLGASGAFFALVYPVFDPYDFPHVTSFSFLVGHYALWVNALIYLFKNYQPNLLKRWQLAVITLAINAGLVLVNILTGGNYGLLSEPPFITGSPLWVIYLAVSLVLIVALLVADFLVANWKAKQALRPQEIYLEN